MTAIVECKYGKNGTPAIIAVFKCIDDAEAYSKRHNGEGGGKLRASEIDYIEHFECRVELRFNRVRPPEIKASFAYRCEAGAWAARQAFWEDGHCVVVQEPLSEALA